MSMLIRVCVFTGLLDIVGPLDPSNYRPFSSLSFIYKLVERAQATLKLHWIKFISTTRSIWFPSPPFYWNSCS